MYVTSDYLTTYDPGYIEEHTDSSDFEDTCPPVNTSRRNGNYTIHSNVYESRSKEEKEFLNQRIFDRKHMYSSVYCQSSKELWSTNKTVRRNTTETDLRMQDTHDNTKRFNNEQVGRQKPQRYKLIPCLSHMFGRINNVKHAAVKENNVKESYADNGYSRCESFGHDMRKLCKTPQCYAEQPVYTVKGNIYSQPIPFGQTNLTQSPTSNLGAHKLQYQTECVQKQSSSQHVTKRTKKQRKKMKKVVSEMRKLQEAKWQRNNKMQCPSRQDWVPPYQVFTSPYHTTEVGCLAKNPDHHRDNLIVSPSSSFWEYVLERFNKKSHSVEAKTPRGCQNAPITQSRGSPEYCEYSVPKLQPEYRQQQQNKLYNECCKCNPNLFPFWPQNPLSPKQSPLLKQSQLPKQIPLPKQSPPLTPPKGSKVYCECPKDMQQNLPQNQPAPNCNVCKSCQQPHDAIIKAVTQKYNGEILCIHNPPCILINGCLNLPSKDEKQVNAWPMMQDKVWSFQQGQACQYPPACSHVQQCQTPDSREEKIVQSICNHSPPCEVVRTCIKPKFDPELYNPCIHVPMCDKLPECVMDEGMTSCEHRPKCLELPICTRNYIMLTAMEEVGVQANSVDSVCRHEPHCVMIPKCLGRVLYDSYVPCDSIPDCVHRPMCEMIPACCRKSPKEMTSSSCQGSISKPVQRQSKLLRMMRRSKVK